MVTDAVGASPSTALLRTAHFRVKGRAQIPARKDPSGSSSIETDIDNGDTVRTRGAGHAVERQEFPPYMEKVIVPLR